MSKKKPSKKFFLGSQGRVVAAVVNTVAENCIEVLVKNVKARRRRLVRRKTRPEVLKLWNTIMREFCARAAHGYDYLHLVLCDSPFGVRSEVEALLMEDKLKGSINSIDSVSHGQSLGIEVTYRWWSS